MEIYYLKNKLGLYLQSMGKMRNDYSFTKDINEAMYFDVLAAAESKKQKFSVLKLSIESVKCWPAFI